jgi:hypothetical protein
VNGERESNLLYNMAWPVRLARFPTMIHVSNVIRNGWTTELIPVGLHNSLSDLRPSNRQSVKRPKEHCHRLDRSSQAWDLAPLYAPTSNLYKQPEVQNQRAVVGPHREPAVPVKFVHNQVTEKTDTNTATHNNSPRRAWAVTKLCSCAGYTISVSSAARSQLLY